MTFIRKDGMQYERNIVFILCFTIVCFISHLITGGGVLLADMKNHVMREIPGLVERCISRDAIHMFSNLHVKTRLGLRDTKTS